jgi:hypothetical protein
VEVDEEQESVGFEEKRKCPQVVKM